MDEWSEGMNLVNWRDGQVGAFDLPNDGGFEPHVRDVLLLITILEVGLGLRDLVGLELLGELLELLVGEASANLGDGLERLGVGIVAGQEEATIDTCE